jgi:glycosyltransferase involved in cell wall biosynthesis
MKHEEGSGEMNGPRVSVVMPAKNEAGAIEAVVRSVRQHVPGAEVIVVDDGSSDDTAAIAEAAGARVVRHRYSMGNGAAIKSGSRSAEGEVIVFMDADGQHDPADIPRLLQRLEEGFDMVVGARASSESHASVGRLLANGTYNVIASLVTGRTIPDLTSGFRAVRADLFKRFLYLLPNGFSYPTTITMAFIRSGFPIDFVDIDARQREGRSHIRPIRDGVRFMVIIFKIATLYAPLKLFLPTSFVFFFVGLGYYGYTYWTMGRFTNMSLLLFSASVVIFLIGLISEQITALNFKDT